MSDTKKADRRIEKFLASMKDPNPARQRFIDERVAYHVLVGKTKQYARELAMTEWLESKGAAVDPAPAAGKP